MQALSTLSGLDAGEFLTLRGIPEGALTELVGERGAGKTELVLRYLALNPKLRCAWIEDEFTAYPCAFPQVGVNLERVLFVESGKQALWTAQQVLRSRIFSVVILATQGLFSEIDFRRLQLLAEQTSSRVILLSEQPTREGGWTFSLRATVRRVHSEVRIQVFKERTKVQWKTGSGT